MTCPSCGQEFVIDSDPQNASYVYISGITASASASASATCDGDEYGDVGDILNAEQTLLEQQRKDPISRVSRQAWQQERVQIQHSYMDALQAVTAAHSKADYDNNAALRQANRRKRETHAQLVQDGRYR